MTPAQRPDNILSFAGKDGAYQRMPSQFRDVVSTEVGATFPAEKDRYHLYISLACPWAHRCLITRRLKGLEDVISLSIVHWKMTATGWHFGSEADDDGDDVGGCIEDTNYGFKYIRDLYCKADPDYTGRFTVPVLWDKNTHTVVNNESSEIIRMFNHSFDAFSKAPGLTLYPVSLVSQIDAVNEWIYPAINNGVYKTGFATSQDVYEKECQALFKALDRVEGMLHMTPFLTGNHFTEADLRLFTTILRFDPVYHGHFKCNIRSIEHGYPAMLHWLRRIYQFDGVAETCDMWHIKQHYYVSHVGQNPTQIVALGEGPDLTVPIAEKGEKWQDLVLKE